MVSWPLQQLFKSIPTSQSLILEYCAISFTIFLFLFYIFYNHLYFKMIIVVSAHKDNNKNFIKIPITDHLPTTVSSV